MPQTPPQTDTYNTALDIFDRTHPLRVDADENLKVVLSSGSIEIGTVDQGTGGSSPWLVRENSSTAATVTAVTVTTSSTTLLAANLSRKGFVAQCKTSNMYVILGITASSSLYSYYLLKLNALEIDNYTGPVAAVVDTGSTTVLVTEKV